jgi:hypothetical protein
MKWLIGLTVATVAITVYVVWLRPLMRETRFGKWLLDHVEPIERALWMKSETILFARLKIVMGLLLTALTQMGGIDIKPLMPLVPDAYEPIVLFIWNLLPLTLTVMGWIDEKLRKDTTKPIEIVAMRTDAPEAVKAAAADAEAVTKDAVAAAVEAKAV